MTAIMKLAALALLAGSATAQLATSIPGCPAPSYFGICNPYVPGVFIGADDNGVISVRSTWHDGPAEKAGICPGDKIVTVDEAIAGDRSLEGLVRRLVSDSPNPVTLHVRRDQEEFELRVPRIRENAVAALSGQKFLDGITSPIPTLPAYYPRVVAEDVTLDDLISLFNFRARLLEGSSNKREGEIDRPAPPPPLHADEYFVGIAVNYDQQRREAVVAEVLFPSPAFNAGVHPGDVILTIKGTPLAKLGRGQLIGAFAPTDSKQLSVVLMRSGKRMTVQLVPVKYGEALHSIGRKITRFGPAPLHCPD
jgi:predicted metalloprotease with PDZ domain